MESFGKDHSLQSRYYEPLDKGRDITSVSTSASVLYVRADHFA